MWWVHHWSTQPSVSREILDTPGHPLRWEHDACNQGWSFLDEGLARLFYAKHDPGYGWVELFYQTGDDELVGDTVEEREVVESEAHAAKRQRDDDDYEQLCRDEDRWLRNMAGDLD